MNNNEGLENIKKQVLDLFSLKKKIGRWDFIVYSISSILLFLLFISFLRDNIYRVFIFVDCVDIIFIGV